MAKGSRSHQRRRERRAAIGRKESGLSTRDARLMADGVDLPDGANSYAMGLAGMDHDRFFGELAEDAR